MKLFDEKIAKIFSGQRSTLCGLFCLLLCYEYVSTL
jgi:hypothetical protein